VNSGDSGLKARDTAVSDWEKWCWGCYQFTCGFSREASRLYVHVVCFRYILVCRELLPLLSSIPNPNLNVIETKENLEVSSRYFVVGGRVISGRNLSTWFLKWSRVTGRSVQFISLPWQEKSGWTENKGHGLLFFM